MKKTRQSILFAIITLLLSSCEMLRQIEEMKTLSKCEFRIHTVTDIQLAGINISKIQSLTDIRPPDILQLTNAAFNNQLPLNFILNLQVNNPNQQVASINHLEWILFIDEMQMLNGAIRETFSAGPGENVTLPVNIVFNLAEVLKGERG